MFGCYARFTGQQRQYAEVAHAAKHQIMQEDLVAEVERMTGLLADVCERHRRQRDHTRRELRDALREIIAAFPVYRTYPRPGQPASAADRAHVAAPLHPPCHPPPHLHPHLPRFTAPLLTGGYPGAAEADFVLRFAQVNAPAMANGEEDP